MLICVFMKNVNEKYFKRDIISLETIFDFISEFFAENNIAASNRFAVDLSIEEIFTNMIKYQGESHDDIAIELKLEQGKLIIIFTGYNVEYFDISNAPNVDTGVPLKEREVGGLGLLLVKKLMDKIDYDYNESTCRIILIKTLEK